MTTDLNDAESPQAVPAILRAAADKYSEAFIELQSAWQDRSAGAEWATISRELEKLADRIERLIK